MGGRGEESRPRPCGASSALESPWLRRHDPKGAGDLWGTKGFEEEREAHPRTDTKMRNNHIFYLTRQSSSSILQFYVYKDGKTNVALVYFLKQSLTIEPWQALNSSSSYNNLPHS